MLVLFYVMNFGGSMKNHENIKSLEDERKKLNQLIDEALQNGTPISKTHAIMKQCKRVNQLILKKQPPREEPS